KPMDPSSKGYAALMRYFSGITDRHRKEFRDRILETSPQEIIEAAKQFLVSRRTQGAISVYAASDRLIRANEVLDGKLVIEDLMA
ncbi:MAG: hypothetical protein V1753_00695, partial [Pseudomonadota bacterium]